MVMAGSECAGYYNTVPSGSSSVLKASFNIMLDNGKY
jgi:hypothetical protein